MGLSGSVGARLANSRRLTLYFLFPTPNSQPPTPTPYSRLPIERPINCFLSVDAYDVMSSFSHATAKIKVLEPADLNQSPSKRIHWCIR